MMKLLNTHILHLLLLGKRVTIEGVGTLIPVCRGAAISEDTVSAPTTSAVFDSSFTAADNAIAESFARSLDIDIDTASDLAAGKCREVAAQLSSSGIYTIDGVGTIRRKGAELCFNVSANFAGASWLSPIRLGIRQEKAAIAASVSTTPDYAGRSREVFIRALSRTASSAAAIAIIALITFIWAQLPQNARHHTQSATFGIESTTAALEPLIPVPGASEPALVLILNTPSDGVAPAKERRPKVNAGDKYFMVVASLASADEARRFIDNCNSGPFHLNVLESQGRWRVYAMSAPTIEGIYTAARDAEIYDIFPSAWVCRR